ncbi:MAG: hypothetical protein AAF713_02790 [Pseudomonadota bacterium]
MYKGADIGASDTAIFKLDRTIQKRLDYKVKRLSSWFVKKFSDVAKREQDVASLKTWQAAAKDFGSAITRYHDLKLDHEAMRRLPIPHDTAARDALLEKLQANTRALHTAVLSIRTSHTALLERTDERAELMNKTGVAMDSKRRTDIKQARVLIDKAMSGVIAGDLAEFDAETKEFHNEKLDCFKRLLHAVSECAQKGLVDPKFVKDIRRGNLSPEQLLSALANAPNKAKANEYRQQVIEPCLNQIKLIDRKLAMRAPNAQSHMLNILEDEHARVTTLRKSLEAASQDGDAALKDILGDPERGEAVQIGDAIQALGSGEPISPHLKDVLDGEKHLRSKPREHGHGAFNTVYSAHLSLPGKDGRLGPAAPYILKPLSGDMRSPFGGGPIVKLARHQTRAFSRQLAAHKLCKRMGLDFVAEPKLVRHDGKLCMAMPQVKGYSADEWVKGIYSNIQSKFAPRVLAALHSNKELQHTIKNVQLFHALAGNVDGHGSNLKIQLIDAKTGQSYNPRGLAELGLDGKFDVIERLKVKVGLFDMDGAFTGITDPTQELPKSQPVRYPHPFEEGAFKAKMAKVPALSHITGPPPFHTKDDFDKVSKLVADLDTDGAARDDFRWCLTGDEADSSSPKSQEIDAIRARGNVLLAEMEKQYADGKRIDPDTSEVLQRTTDKDGKQVEVRKKVDQPEQKAIDDAKNIVTFKTSRWGYVVRKAAAMEKYFPLRHIYRT